MRPGRHLELFIVLFFFFFVGCAGAEKKTEQNNLAPVSQVESKEDRGIEIVSLRVTAAGHILDLRYRVTDPEKAAAVFDRRNKAFLIDQASGKALGVPRTAKVGPLRQTNFEPDPKRVYFILFSNAEQIVGPGSLVTLMVGDYRFENIEVQ